VQIALSKLMSRYDRTTGDEVAQNMKSSTIMAHAHEEVKTLFASAQCGVRNDIQQMRGCIFEAAIGPRLRRHAISKGKDEGKGGCQICHRPNHTAKGCNLRGKDNGTRKEQGLKLQDQHRPYGKDYRMSTINNDVFTGKCDHCHKTAHNKADIRKEAAEEKAKGNAAIQQDDSSGRVSRAKIERAEDEFECDIFDDDQLCCTAMKVDDAAEEWSASDGDTVFIALDTASDYHVASKPILSMFEVMDAGAEFWLGAKIGAAMCPGGDLSKGALLTAKNSALGFDAEPFRCASEARERQARANANEQEDGGPGPSPGASGSGPIGAPPTEGPAAPEPLAPEHTAAALRERLAAQSALQCNGQEIAPRQ
ncbi:unnamed protein product, partial [Prorocentrum cordatum]